MKQPSAPIWVPREKIPGHESEEAPPRYQNVLFLDVDGVLLTESSFRLNNLLRRPLEKELFDPLSLFWLRRLIRRTGAAVILSSSWRDGLTIDDDFSRTITDNLFSALARNGTPFADATPLCLDGDKGTEIAAWLDRYPCDRYMVVDDHDCFSCRPDVRDHWVPVPNSRGLRGPEARAVIRGFREGGWAQ